ncbi:PREDICTED: piggyBac transposable element-derived protein 4-like [Habropoda laboriosa]|uniref:piggyBac transposable element-derived protein 4-like n=1 Tax=Habropoda laboriosa TaxID=597456 RepID=UPI00083E5320|nr:PREDICTED: piggyBac transposable element-derived protein 4-like [Habropoda laboriosa]
MFIGRRESTIESESSDENVVSFRRKVRNRISSSSSSDTDESYASEDIEELLEELALDEEEKLNTADNSLENIRQQSFPFTGKSGLLLDLPSGISPGEVLSLFLNETVISLLVTETNRYAEQKLLEHKTTGHAGQNKWNLTTSEEIKKFIGLMIWMGLVQTPLKKCWSTDPVYNFSLPRSTMSRNRFEELLSNLHFANNETIVQNNKLGKVLPLVDILMVNYQKVFSPGKDIVVDETMVPWRGRLVFRQYIPTKSHKYGVKLFKLCSTEGYTWSSKIYSGRDTSGKRKVGIAESVCTELADKLLNEGRTLFVDNFYTSYELALKFLNSKTHVVGTVRRNKKKKPSCVMYPLKRGEMVAREDPNGIKWYYISKWRDVRDVTILSTKHPPIMTPSSNSTHRGRPTKMKPLAIREYNIGKSGIDRSDQMVSYATNIRKTIRYNDITEWLSSKDTVPNPNRPKRRNLSHHLEIRKNQQGKPVRKMYSSSGEVAPSCINSKASIVVHQSTDTHQPETAAVEISLHPVPTSTIEQHRSETVHNSRRNSLQRMPIGACNIINRSPPERDSSSHPAAQLQEQRTRGRLQNRRWVKYTQILSFMAPSYEDRVKSLKAKREAFKLELKAFKEVLQTYKIDTPSSELQFRLEDLE